MPSTYTIPTDKPILDVAEAFAQIAGYRRHGMTGTATSGVKATRHEYCAISFLRPSRSEFSDSIPVDATIERTEDGYLITINGERVLDLEKMKRKLQSKH